jgi:hypothetical protein
LKKVFSCPTWHFSRHFQRVQVRSKQAVPGSAVPEKEQIESFMKDIDEGIKSRFFSILDI